MKFIKGQRVTVVAEAVTLPIYCPSAAADPWYGPSPLLLANLRKHVLTRSQLPPRAMHLHSFEILPCKSWRPFP